MSPSRTRSANHSRIVRAYAPASIGNFAAGFDILGAALAPLDGSLLGDIVQVEAASEDAFAVKGPYASRLKRESRPNLALRTRDLFREKLKEKELPVTPVAMTLEKHLPLSSGLGSSGSSIVATLVALQTLFGEPLTRAELLDLAARAEGAYSGTPILDNVASSLLGGLQMVVPGSASLRTLPWPEDLLLVVAHPAFELPTVQSRSVLPLVLGISSAVEFASNLAAFVHALHTHDRRLLGRCLRDVMAEPHRASLVPGFAEAKRDALSAGALGCSLSGSGPSMFAVADSDAAAADISQAISSAFVAAGQESRTWICGLDLQGARVLA
jgi:homoserine kinase